MIKIGTTRGYTIFYDEMRKLFILEDKEKNDMGSGTTQDEVEVKAEKLSKQAFEFPIPALKTSFLAIEKGRLTSVNVDSKSAYFSFDDKDKSHIKINLRYDKAYELTEANSRIYEQVGECHRQIKEVEGTIKGLINQLEKPIDLLYFGLKEGWCAEAS